MLKTLRDDAIVKQRMVHEQLRLHGFQLRCCHCSKTSRLDIAVSLSCLLGTEEFCDREKRIFIESIKYS